MTFDITYNSHVIELSRIRVRRSSTPPFFPKVLKLDKKPLFFVFLRKCDGIAKFRTSEKSELFVTTVVYQVFFPIELLTYFLTAVTPQLPPIVVIQLFNKKSQQKVSNALFSNGSEYTRIYIVSQCSGTEIYIHKTTLTTP